MRSLFSRGDAEEEEDKRECEEGVKSMAGKYHDRVQITSNGGNSEADLLW